MMEPARDKKFSAVAGVILTLLAVATVRLCFRQGYGGSFDEFFHVRLASLGWSVYGGGSFPAMTLSSWCGGFADKELGFHLILQWTQLLSGWIGLPEFPFTLSRFFFIGLLAGAFGWAAWHFGVRRLWAFIPLLFLAEPAFCARAMMLRPHLLAVALMLAGSVVFDSVKGWRDCWKSALLTLIFGLCYSNGHFILLPLGAFALAHFVRNRRRGIAIVSSGVVGLALSFLLHPQFPANLLLWKIQCVDVVRNMLASGDAKTLMIAGEATASGAGLYWAFKGLSALFLLWAGCAAWQLGALKKEFFARPDRVAIGIIALISFAGVAFALRAIEYALPFNLLAAGCFLADTPWRPKWRIAVLLWAAVYLAAGWRVYERMHRLSPMDKLCVPCGEVAEFVRGRYPAGTVIGNIHWGDFPMIYYSLPEYRFLYGLDPFFAYSADPERYEWIERFRLDGRFLPPAPALRELFGTGIFYTRAPHMISKLTAAGGAVLYSGEDGAIVELP